MHPGQAGPLHGIDAEQVWTVLAGGAIIELGGDILDVGPGDTVIMAADLPRRIIADASLGLAAVVAAPASLRAYVIDGIGPGRDRAVPADAKVVPAWVV